MALKKLLALYSGVLKELQSGDLIDPAQITLPGSMAVSSRVVNPADGATYFWGSCTGVPPDTTGGLQKIYMPRTCTIKKAWVMWSASVAGSNENVSIYIRVNNTTDYLIATVGNTNAFKEFINTSLSISITIGDYIEFKIVCPTWATNPTQVGCGGTIYFE